MPYVRLRECPLSLIDIRGFGMAVRKRRKWSDEEKVSICHQTRARGVSVSQVARRYAMSGNQIFNWLKDLRFGPYVCHDEGGDTGFIQIEVEAMPASTLLPTVVAPAADAGSRPPQNGKLEIMLAGGHGQILASLCFNIHINLASRKRPAPHRATFPLFI
jgi:transposase